MNSKSDKLFYLLVCAITYGIVIGGIYLLDEYVGFLINGIFLVMTLAVLIISLISEKIERTKISSLYFYSLIGILVGGTLLMLIMELQV